MSTDIADPAALGGLEKPERARRLPVPISVGIAGLILMIVAAWAVMPALFSPGDATTINPGQGLEPASSAHLAGTDALGRDVLSRVVHGARSALLGPLIVASGALVISTVLALSVGYFGGWIDAVVSRAGDILYSLPPLIVAIVLVGVFGGGYWLAVAVLVVLNVPQNLRLLRAAVMERRNLPYVEAAEVLGVTPLRIMARHLLPNIAPVVAAAFFVRFTYGLVDLSALSFLGLGVPPGSTDWGRMLAENRVHLFQNAWAAIAPGVALLLTAVSANFVGDWLYEHFERRARSR